VKGFPQGPNTSLEKIATARIVNTVMLNLGRLCTSKFPDKAELEKFLLVFRLWISDNHQPTVIETTETHHLNDRSQDNGIEKMQ
jgi:hypothetical protein